MMIRSRSLAPAPADQSVDDGPPPPALGGAYRVRWEIDVHADSHRQAAQQAQQIQRKRASIATVFHVVGPDGAAQAVDLLADD